MGRVLFKEIHFRFEFHEAPSDYSVETGSEGQDQKWEVVLVILTKADDGTS